MNHPRLPSAGHRIAGTLVLISGGLLLTGFTATPSVCETLQNGDVVYGDVNDDFPSVPASSGTFRAVAVQNRQSIAAAETYESWDAEMSRLMALAEPLFRQDAPTLVAFGEYSALPAAFIGSRGAAARDAASYEEAMAALMASYRRQMGIYLQCYPGISPVTALELSLTDTMWRAFYTSFSRLADTYDVYLSAAMIAPEIQVSERPRDLLLFGDPDLEDAEEVYLPVGTAVYNVGVLFDPDGQIVGVTRKVNLTASEGAGSTTLNLTSGDLDDVRVFETPMGRLGFATCYDAFFDSYVSRLNDLGASILVQPSWNNGMWANDGSIWQPEDWTNATLGAIAGEYSSIQYNINTMVTGNLFDMVVDGQSAISRKSDTPPAPDPLYVGLDPITDRTGEYVALAPWAMDDPGDDDPSLSLEERRARLHARALELAPGSGSSLENGYVETVIAADLDIVP